MKTSLTIRSGHVTQLLLAGLLAFASAGLRAAEEDDLIATLQSGANVVQKCSACQRLRTVGTPKAVPALAALLTEERASHAARHALEGLPFPEAGTALRQALGKTSGLVKAGILDSLGWRGEKESVPLIVPLLSDADADIAGAAASALGRIGGQEAVVALSAARDQAPAAIRPAVFEGLLQCAERLLAAKDNAGAMAIYRGLFDGAFPAQIRAAAWRGLARSDAGQRADMLVKALAGNEQIFKMAALKLLRELNDQKAIQVCLEKWPTLPPESQLAVLDAHVAAGAVALPTVHKASASPHLAVRMAAWQAFGELGDPSAIPALAKAASGGEPDERDAARGGLARVRGPGARAALLAHIASGPDEEKAELLRVLGERGDTASAEVLVRYAAAESDPVGLAALDSLRRLAVPATIAPLLELAAKSPSDTRRNSLLKALYAACQASPDKDQAARSVIAAMGRFPAAERRHVLPLLAELATADALAAAQTATRDQDPELAREAVGVLAQWPNAAPAQPLLDLARTSADPTMQILALRGGIEVAGQESDLTKRLALLKQAMAIASRPDEKKHALGQIGQVPNSEALDLALANLADAGLVNEAALAAVSIAEKLAPSNPQLADQVAEKVLGEVKTGDIAKRAWALRIKPASGASFIRDWLICGPYRQADVTGALALFNLAFGPEKPGEKVEWKRAPQTDHVNLAGLFPGQDNCVAYLRTHLIAPRDCAGALLAGSDDGIKAWLNGKVIHSNNVDRPEKVDEDTAPIQLNPGTNELMLKITQGAGGWSVSARVVGSDGRPIPGLMVVLPGGAARPVAVAPPAPAPQVKPATLPPRDSFDTLRLSDQFYAEGAFSGDFNRDGRMDIVAGPFWFEGPGFQKRHEYRPAKVYDPKGYSDNFLAFTGDFNADGWTDIFCVPFPGAEGFWFENPAGKDGPWPNHLAYNVVGNESPVWGDVTGDGKPELVCCNEGFLGYAGPDPAKPAEPWVFRAISTQDKRYNKFTHGVGIGDIDGDKRTDIVEAAGWWEQPAEAKSGQPWTFHPFHFADAGAQMLVNDVNGDGLNDLITAWHCHLYGLVWWQQVKSANGQPEWKKNVIFTASPDLSTTDFRPSQLHALELVDMNGDGLKDVLTGKRFWAHGPTGDKEPDAPAVVFWLELRRDGKGGATFVPHLIDDNSGVGTQVAVANLNRDTRPDVIVANKKGIFVHLSKP